MIVIIMEYVKGDKVIVYLSAKDRTHESVDYKICKVVASGEFDLMCETISTYSRLFKVSKERCVKIEKRDFNHSQAQPRKPKVGDLVLSMRDTFREDRDEFTGIVENIIYDPTKNTNPMYVVRIGQKTVRAYLENIIILESAN